MFLRGLVLAFGALLLALLPAHPWRAILVHLGVPEELRDGGEHPTDGFGCGPWESPTFVLRAVPQGGTLASQKVLGTVHAERFVVHESIGGERRSWETDLGGERRALVQRALDRFVLLVERPGGPALERWTKTPTMLGLADGGTPRWSDAPPSWRHETLLGPAALARLEPPLHALSLLADERGLLAIHGEPRHLSQMVIDREAGFVTLCDARELPQLAHVSWLARVRRGADVLWYGSDFPCPSTLLLTDLHGDGTIDRWEAVGPHALASSIPLDPVEHLAGEETGR